MKRSLKPGAVPSQYQLAERGEWSTVAAAVVEEAPLCIHVNGQKLATIMCTPIHPEALALGFLRAEGFIDGLADIASIRLSEKRTCVDIWLHRTFTRPRHSIKTSGCGGGLTFDDLTSRREPLPLTELVPTARIIERYFELQAKATLYPLTRGVHASVLCTQEKVLVMAEDVGRHNTLDKLWGRAMQLGIETEGRLIITTGRISSEMLGKAAKMGVPVVASRTSPTSRSVSLAQAWNITLIGYVRRYGLRVYAAPERLADFPGASGRVNLPADSPRLINMVK
jgi:FdhD protein